MPSVPPKPEFVSTAAQWQVVKQILDEALDLEESRRAGHVNSATNDPSIRSEVLRLLASWNNAESWFERAGQAVAHLTSGPTFEPGDILGERYCIRRFIARGGMGEVYEAEDKDLSGMVALKILRPSLALNADLAARFRTEIQLSRAINSPHICRVHDIGYHRDAEGGMTTFYTMELLVGETLAAHLHLKGSYSLVEARPIIRDMALGLDAAHQHGILHRDFKPGNIMLTSSGAVITDFGLALNTATDPDSVLAATPAYASPEQLTNQEQSTATDVYSFGVVLYEMLTGKTPAVLASRAVPKIILQCLTKDPLERPRSAMQWN